MKIIRDHQPDPDAQLRALDRLLQSVPHPDAPDNEVTEDRPAPTSEREPVELRPETDDAA